MVSGAVGVASADGGVPGGASVTGSMPVPVGLVSLGAISGGFVGSCTGLGGPHAGSARTNPSTSNGFEGIACFVQQLRLPDSASLSVADLRAETRLASAVTPVTGKLPER